MALGTQTKPYDCSYEFYLYSQKAGPCSIDLFPILRRLSQFCIKGLIKQKSRIFLMELFYSHLIIYILKNYLTGFAYF